MKHMIITKELVIDGYNTRNSKPVFCITTGEIFPSQKKRQKHLGLIIVQLAIVVRVSARQ